MQTTLAAILAEHGTTYTAVAARANVQPRTVRQIAMGETPIDHVQVGTLRRIAAALGVPVAALLDGGAPHPGDPTLDRASRLSRAIADVMWAGTPAAYPSPVEGPVDALAEAPPDEFFTGMAAIDERRG